MYLNHQAQNKHPTFYNPPKAQSSIKPTPVKFSQTHPFTSFLPHPVIPTGYYTKPRPPSPTPHSTSPFPQKSPNPFPNPTNTFPKPYLTPNTPWQSKTSQTIFPAKNDSTARINFNAIGWLGFVRRVPWTIFKTGNSQERSTRANS